jgi:hypothetical protein
MLNKTKHPKDQMIRRPVPSCREINLVLLHADACWGEKSTVNRAMSIDCCMASMSLRMQATTKHSWIHEIVLQFACFNDWQQRSDVKDTTVDIMGNVFSAWNRRQQQQQRSKFGVIRSTPSQMRDDVTNANVNWALSDRQVIAEQA